MTHTLSDIQAVSVSQVPQVPKVVIDPQAVCMGLIAGDPQLLKLLSLCREGRCIALVSRETARELWAYLSCAPYHFAPLDKRKALVKGFVKQCLRLKVRARLRPGPVGDRRNDTPRHFSSVMLAMAGRANVLVTHQPDQVPHAASMGFRVMAPAEFLSDLVPDTRYQPYKLSHPGALH